MSEQPVPPPQETSCAQCRELLSAYVDRELTAVERGQVEQHLRTCGKCANESTMLVGLKKFMQHWEGVSGSPQFHERVLQQMVHESRLMPARPFVEAAEQARAAGAAPPSAPQGWTRGQWVCLAVGLGLLAGAALWVFYSWWCG